MAKAVLDDQVIALAQAGGHGQIGHEAGGGQQYRLALQPCGQGLFQGGMCWTIATDKGRGATACCTGGRTMGQIQIVIAAEVVQRTLRRPHPLTGQTFEESAAALSMLPLALTLGRRQTLC